MVRGGKTMAKLLDEPCSSCHRQTVEVEFKYLHPWRLGIVWAIVLLVLGVAAFIPIPHGWRLTSARVVAGMIAIILHEFLGPRLAKRTAYLRCRVCGETRSRSAIHDLETAAKSDGSADD